MRNAKAILGLVLSAFSTLFGLELELEFDKSKLSLVPFGYYTRIKYDGGEITCKPGEPELPSLPIKVLLPPGEKATDITFEIISKEEIPGTHKVYPTQKPAIIPIPGLPTKIPEFTPPSEEIYTRDTAFPANAVNFASTGFLREYSLCGIIACPLIYYPSSGKLEFITKIKVKIETRPTQFTKPRKSSSITKNLSRRLVSKLVANPELIHQYDNMYILDETAYDYLIITSEQFYRLIEPYRRLLKESGFKDTVVTTSTINTLIDGRDLAEKIRNFARLLYEEYGIYYILLFGDVDRVPSRVAFAMDCEAGFFRDENDIRADYYFSCLDGNWNLNENDTFGEVEDSVDLYPELIVGRIPAGAREDIITSINKNTTYRNNPPTGYLTHSLFASEILWWDPYTDSGIGKNMLLSLFPLHFEIERLYHSLGNENLTTVMNSLNAGKGIFNHYGHGFVTLMGVGEDEYLDIYAARSLSNGDKVGIGYSIGCWVAAFDYSNCVAEELVNNPGGGTIAFVGNNRYGWGSPGNPGYGYSERYDYCYFNAIFKKGIKSIGDALAFCKSYYAPASINANLFRWHEYQLNLLGDPSLTLWTNEPQILQLAHPETIVTTTGAIDVFVKNEYGDPVENATVAVVQSNSLVGRGTTDINGIAHINLNPTLENGYATLVCSKEDYKKVLDSVAVITGGVSLRLGNYGFILEDGTTRRNEIPAGSSDTLFFAVINDGTSRADSGTIELVPPRPATVYNRLFAFPTLAPGESITGKTTIYIPTNMRTPFRLTMNITTPSIARTEYISVVPVYPNLNPKHYLIYGRTNYLVPGESSTIRFLFKNEGSYRSDMCDVHIRALTPNAIFPVANFTLPQANPNETVTHEPVPIYIPCETRTGEIIAVEFRLIFADSTIDYDTLNIVVGRYLFFDDAERESEMYHTGSPDIWSRTELRAHSGRFSYGYTSDGAYPNNANGKLITPPIVFHPGICLSFWVYYDVATYGNDGLYVKLIHERGDTSTIDYLGSGGALPPMLGFSTGWVKMDYNIVCAPGEQFKILFEVVTDSAGTGNGFFIDDIMLYVPYENATSISENPQQNKEKIVVFPNPTNSAFTIEYESNSKLELELFDILGRKVESVSVMPEHGKIIVGKNLPSGVYFIRARTDNKQEIKRCVVIK